MLGFTPEKPLETTEEKQDEHKVDCRGASRVAEPEHMPTCVRTRAGQENDKKRVNGDTRNRDPYVTRLESRRLMSLHNALLVNGRSCERTRTSHTATNLDVNHTRGSGRDGGNTTNAAGMRRGEAEGVPAARPVKMRVASPS